MVNQVNEVLNEKFDIKGLIISFASENVSPLEKIRFTAPELEFLIKQYQCYVEEGFIDFDLIKISSSQLHLSKVKSKLKKKYIYGESISQTLSYALRAADMGFVAKSALFSPKMAHYKEGKDWQELDSSLYTPINQGIVILKYARDKEDVVKFYNFILGKESQKILQKFGYAIP